MTDRAPDPFAVHELERRLAEAYDSIETLRREKAELQEQVGWLNAERNALRVRLDRVVEERAREEEG